MAAEYGGIGGKGDDMQTDDIDMLMNQIEVKDHYF